MAVNPAERDAQTLRDFFNSIYGAEQGFVYLAFKSPQGQGFQQAFYRWPEQAEGLVADALAKRGTQEVYYGPALYSAPEAKKQNVLGSRVFWIELDGKSIDAWEGLPEPAIRVQSSTDGHEHIYWRTDTLVSPDTVERINRALTYKFGADSSGWDSTQILRPPATLNHKRGREVKLLVTSDSTIDPEVFSNLPEPPPLADEPVPERIPAVEDVIAIYKFPKQAWKLFKAGVPEGKRSDGLMSLGYYCAEMGMQNEEVLAILTNADQRWGKFAHRQDRFRRLMEIVTKARLKYPLVGERPSESLTSMGLKTLMATEVHLEWIWKGFLQRGGFMLLTGPSGIGKTQFSLNFGASVSLGHNFLDSDVSGARRIGFFSLEMGLVDLKHFLGSQMQGYTEMELAILEKNLRFYPLGEPLYLNRDEEKERVEKAIHDDQLEGLIVDSLGSTTDGELTDEKDTKNVLDWMDRIRQRYGVFCWMVHHHRKATGDNKKPNKLSDVYGSQYITARATSVVALWDSGIPNTLDFLPLKMRLAAKPEKFHVFRDGNLRFTRKVSGITVVSQPAKDEPKPKDAPVAVTPAEKPNFDI